MSITLDQADDVGELAPAFIADGIALTLVAERSPAASCPAAPYGTVAVALDGRATRIAAAPHERGGGPDGSQMRALLARLDPPSRLRLLRFLLGFCRSAFRLGGARIFAETCRRLVAETLPEPAVATPAARLTNGTMLLHGLFAPAGAALHVLGQERVFCSAIPGRGDVAGQDAVRAIEAVQEGDLIVADCETPACWRVGPARLPLPHVLERLAAGPGADELRRAAIRALMPAARSNQAASVLLRDIGSLAPLPERRHADLAQPVGAALELALPDGGGGLFLRGWLRDPIGQVERAELLTNAGITPVRLAELHRVPRPDLAEAHARAPHRSAAIGAPGFVAHLDDPSHGHTLQPQLRLCLRSGAAILLTPPPRHLPPAAARDAVLSALPAALAGGAAFEQCIAPATRRLHRLAMADQGKPAVLRLGRAAPRRPAVSVLIPVYRTLGFIPFQLAAFAQDPALREAEIILCLDSPEQAPELEHLLRGLTVLHDLGVTLVVMPRNLGFAAAINTAAREARAPALLLLNSDVVPAAPGWLAPMLAALRPPSIGAVGPKLLFEDNSVQHAGLYFERDADGVWFNRHYYKGLPRHWPAAGRSRPVPAVTGGALMTRRATFERLGGIDERYVIGDYEDSDLCLRLQQAGLRIAYVAEAELYHFERRSIALHGGYATTLAAHYNRRLHDARWSDLIGLVMARFGVASASSASTRPAARAAKLAA